MFLMQCNRTRSKKERIKRSEEDKSIKPDVKQESPNRTHLSSSCLSEQQKYLMDKEAELRRTRLSRPHLHIMHDNTHFVQLERQRRIKQDIIKDQAISVE